MDFKELLSRPFSTIADWCKAHESLFAVKISRIIAVVFIFIAFYFLLKSLGLL